MRAHFDVGVSAVAHHAVMGKAGRNIDLHFAEFQLCDARAHPPLVESLIPERYKLWSDENLLSVCYIKSIFCQCPIRLKGCGILGLSVEKALRFAGG